jgi:hypothetical protein
MLNLRNYELVLTKHAIDKLKQKGFTLHLVNETFLRPEQIRASGSYPGQYKIIGNNIVLIGVPNDRRHFTVVTIYRSNKSVGFNFRGFECMRH